ncbi:bifunctional proline dehydrogenase/L-glutamate gamma-semialdehyde dehydrogenase PutA [Limibacillus halophilus]|uniref:Bifunctional protein PutA n=1 Tax=Limibacillus halophilus TaxID=1579333 RepID=A0A839SRM6_9PROT|nr:bifunctional proline dehydrogenase/L-glutamate gamma-semialdehyde dehydrogenase PutA [Limibacillus halophilus]MBB3064444.1 RHH-type proline utilization regulon transcriptional repressor/proline dehydrogenase/delta 1-pyrroline-5-carboxylate dehydrogenase [Limibacillus halophilus]
MLIDPKLAHSSDLRRKLRDTTFADESETVAALLDEATLGSVQVERVQEKARQLVQEVRRSSVGHGGIDAFLYEYELSSKEGIVLMCLAEALLRVPDADTRDRLIKDKISAADWQSHLGRSDSLFVNASTWALMLTGRVVRLDEAQKDFSGVLGRLVHRSGEPVIRTAVTQAMRILGRQFVMGRNIKEAIERARSDEAKGYRYSYDMLGEAARTMADAERYFESYRKAIAAIGKAGKGKSVADSPGISVKLSALHPRYEFSQRDRVMKELMPRLLQLAVEAKELDIGLTVDAEEVDRLDLSLDVIEAVSSSSEIKGWHGYGLAIQGYQKRARPLIDWLADMAKRHKRQLMVRLVKGAYWDTEIKRSQERGLPGYPVFTRKVNTDVSYLACARALLADPKAFYPQFATHNAHSVASVLEMAGNHAGFEFQRLHGMGEALYAQVVGKDKLDIPTRIYAPVGSHEDLLAYLVRRLLENGANSSFVNRIQDEKLPVDEIVADPLVKVRNLSRIPHPKIPLPVDLYGEERPNSAGMDVSNPVVVSDFAERMGTVSQTLWQAAPLVGGKALAGKLRKVHNPADRREVVGEVVEADAKMVEQALSRAERAQWDWNATSAHTRADCLMRLADLMEEESSRLIAICIREAGKTFADGIAEVREAVDFCRYYAARAREHFAEPKIMPGPTGERNELRLGGRGVFVCISPWNFPLAIFTGQITAALAAGNSVIAKPAEQTPLIATAAVQLMHRAGIPEDVIQLLPGDGATVGGPLVADSRIAGVAFTGSTETARIINRVLAERDGPIIPFIAETGGQNAMIVDSTALPEQVVNDVVISSFQSAGQRCSALRVLFVQDSVADRMLKMLKGAMAELRVGNPSLLQTDVGPVIDEEARDMLEAHVTRMSSEAKVLARSDLGKDCKHGTFVAPTAVEIDSISRLQREVFGPILHVVRYKADRLDQVVEAINGTGYGLTFGIHSRIDSTVNALYHKVRAGNAYVNRNMIGAIVGVQPFGGERLSGTGPKAGGPHYLFRFASEHSLSIDTTAAGGNASLMSLEEDLPI